MNLNESTSKHIEVTASVMAEVTAEFSKLGAETPPFNVAAYSKTVAEKYSVDDLFVAHLVRSVVNSSEEFESRRGRGGGVIRKGTKPEPKKAKPKAEKLAQSEVSTETAEEAPATERAPMLAPTEEPAVALEVVEPGPAIEIVENDEPLVAASPDDEWLENLMAEVS